MIKKTLVAAILVMLFCASFASSNNNVIKDNNAVNCNSKSTEIENILNRGKTAYAYCAYCPSMSEGPVYFDLENPEDITLLAPTSSGDLLTGGTWADGYGWLAVEYGSGILWNIDPDTGEMTCLGGGISGLDIAWDDLTWELYSCNGYSIIGKDVIELNTTVPIVSFAFNSEGVCYGIDNTINSLHIIDIFTGEVTFVANLSINLDYYSNYISFDKDNDILYLLTDGLYIVNINTGECTLIGSMGGAELTAFAIPYTNFNPPPITTISFDPPEPDGDNNWYISNVTVTLNATDEDEVNYTYYRINGGEWEIYNSPFVLSEDGQDILIEFYSTDLLGNIEGIKSATIDIDQTPPDIIINYKITKIGYKEWLIEFDFTVTDNTSGVSIINILINDFIHQTFTGPGPKYNWSFTASGQKFTLGIDAWDIAGNNAFKETQIKYSKNKNYLSNNQLLLNILEKYPFFYKFFQRVGLF